MIKNMVKEFKFGKMVPFTKDSGKMIKHVELEGTKLY